MKIPKPVLFASYVLNLTLVSAFIDYGIFTSRDPYNFKKPKETFPVVLIQKTDNELRALNLFKRETFLDGRALAPAQIINNHVTTAPILRIPLRISWENKTVSFPTDFAKEAPSVVSIIETASCNICQKLKNKWVIKKGNHLVNEMIIVPSQLQLIVESGAILNFTEEGGIFSRSPLLANNSVFSGEKWKGITVLNQSTKKSTLKDCLIEGGTGLEIFGMKYTGTVNFILGEIDLINITFQNSQSEDALNVKWVSGKIVKAKFVNSFSDALDIDWSDIELNELEVNITGNECLDLSGGKVSLEKARLNRCGDKGISNGENNIMKAKDVKISQCKTAIANKDGGNITLNDILVTNSEVAFHQYHQKTFYQEPLSFFNENVKFEQISDTLKVEAGKVSGHESL